jgi:membrane protein
MLRALRVPIGWGELFRRTYAEVMADNCLGLAAQLAYYFFLALFPALLFLLAIISFVPVHNLMETITTTLGRVAPTDVLNLIRDQILEIAQDKDGGLLTLGMLGTIWSTSSGMTAIIDTLNHAYDIQEGRTWWRVRVTAVGLTVALAVFIVGSTVLVVAGPAIADKVAGWFHLGGAFALIWKIVQWPVVFALVTLGIGLIYYYAPDAEQEWVWITPGSILATLLWLLISLGFRLYVTNFGAYTETYGAVGGVIVVMLWFYLSGLAILVGAELNAEIEHASPYGKEPGEKIPGEKKKIGSLAERLWNGAKASGTFRPAFANENCDLDHEVTPAPTGDRTPRASDWILGGVPLVAATVITFAKLWKRLQSRPAASFRYIGPERRRLPRAS